MKIGIQGDQGSACDAAAARFAEQRNVDTEFEYLTNAERTLEALNSGAVDFVLLAVESPIGTPVPETAAALARYSAVVAVAELEGEVRHCIMTLPEGENTITKIASHPVALRKHEAFLSQRFPGYEAVEIEDSGLAARKLSEGLLTPDTAVIALPRAADLFGLKILEEDLPANDNYLTRFVLAKKGEA